MERRYNVEAPITAVRAGGGATIQGYAAVFFDGSPETEYELWGGVRERILPGAFDGVLAGKGPDVVALRNHDPDRLLARRSAGNLRLTVDNRGLRYEADLADTSAARDTIEDLRAGNLKGSSFAFQVVAEEWRDDGDDQIRELKDLQVHDVGPVTYPAYEGTTADTRFAEARSRRDRWALRARVAARLAEMERGA